MKHKFESAYILQKTQNSRCPVCNCKVFLLTHKNATLEPSFYICENCGYIAEVGVGPVGGEKLKRLQ